MPIYEYKCRSCNAKFELLRSVREMDEKPKCAKCGGEDTERLLSKFSCASDDCKSPSRPFS